MDCAWRVRNSQQEAAFDAFRDTLQEVKKKTSSCARLFHGTKYENAYAIVRDGFTKLTCDLKRKLKALVPGSVVRTIL